MADRRAAAMAGVAPLSPRKKWRAVLFATLLFVPAYWALLVGAVSIATDDADAPIATPFVAFGLALIPFVFVVLAFVSEHPQAPAAIAKAMVLSLVVGIPLSALAADAVTGIVAGMGAGGIVALRADLDHDRRLRIVAVVLSTAWVFVTLRVAPDVALLLAPALPFTSLAIADHFSERRAERARAGV